MITTIFQHGELTDNVQLPYPYDSSSTPTIYYFQYRVQGLNEPFRRIVDPQTGTVMTLAAVDTACQYYNRYAAMGGQCFPTTGYCENSPSQCIQNQCPSHYLIDSSGTTGINCNTRSFYQHPISLPTLPIRQDVNKITITEATTLITTTHDIVKIYFTGSPFANINNQIEPQVNCIPDTICGVIPSLEVTYTPGTTTSMLSFPLYPYHGFTSSKPVKFTFHIEFQQTFAPYSIIRTIDVPITYMTQQQYYHLQSKYYGDGRYQVCNPEGTDFTHPLTSNQFPVTKPALMKCICIGSTLDDEDITSIRYYGSRCQYKLIPHQPIDGVTPFGDAAWFQIEVADGYRVPSYKIPIDSSSTITKNDLFRPKKYNDGSIEPFKFALYTPIQGQRPYNEYSGTFTREIWTNTLTIFEPEDNNITTSISIPLRFETASMCFSGQSSPTCITAHTVGCGWDGQCICLRNQNFGYMGHICQFQYRIQPVLPSTHTTAATLLGATNSLIDMKPIVLGFPIRITFNDFNTGDASSYLFTIKLTFLETFYDEIIIGGSKPQLEFTNLRINMQKYIEINIPDETLVPWFQTPSHSNFPTTIQISGVHSPPNMNNRIPTYDFTANVAIGSNFATSRQFIRSIVASSEVNHNYNLCSLTHSLLGDTTDIDIVPFYRTKRVNIKSYLMNPYNVAKDLVPLTTFLPKINTKRTCICNVPYYDEQYQHIFMYVGVYCQTLISFPFHRYYYQGQIITYTIVSQDPIRPIVDFTNDSLYLWTYDHVRRQFGSKPNIITMNGNYNQFIIPTAAPSPIYTPSTTITPSTQPLSNTYHFAMEKRSEDILPPSPEQQDPAQHDVLFTPGFHIVKPCDYMALVSHAYQCIPNNSQPNICAPNHIQKQFCQCKIGYFGPDCRLLIQIIQPTTRQTIDFVKNRGIIMTNVDYILQITSTSPVNPLTISNSDEKWFITMNFKGTTNPIDNIIIGYSATTTYTQIIQFPSTYPFNQPITASVSITNLDSDPNTFIYNGPIGYYSTTTSKYEQVIIYQPNSIASTYLRPINQELICTYYNQFGIAQSNNNGNIDINNNNQLQITIPRQIYPSISLSNTPWLSCHCMNPTSFGLNCEYNLILNDMNEHIP